MSTEKKLTPSEALFGFCEWLTTREKETVMASNVDCSDIAEKIKLFCEINDLKEPGQHYNKKLKDITPELESVLNDGEKVVRFPVTSNIPELDTDKWEIDWDAVDLLSLSAEQIKKIDGVMKSTAVKTHKIAGVYQ
jgi:hypothetical protein